MLNFQQAINSESPILAEGSMYDRLNRFAGNYFDPELAHLGLVYSSQGQAALSSSYLDYIHVAANAGLPIVVFTPTWRANSERIARSELRDKKPNESAVDFVLKLRNEYCSQTKSPVYVGGITGCRGDCYDPSGALSELEAEKFHSFQINILTQAGVDFLFASTLPSVKEAIGIARAMSATSSPYILSFVVDQDGHVLDGTPLTDAVRTIDQAVDCLLLGYFVNCVHPSVLLSGLNLLSSSHGYLRERLIGFQGNTSTRDPREFDSLTELETQRPDEFAKASNQLRREFGLRILGGCCGTGPEHIEAIASLIR